MKKIINVLGVDLDNYSTRESLQLIDAYLNEQIMHVVGIVFMDLLILAGEDLKVRESIESLDLTIVGDKEILAVAGITRGFRVRETVGNEFVAHFLERLSQKKCKIFLLCNTDEECQMFQEYLKEKYPACVVAATYAVEKCKEDYDVVVNEINIVEPDVVFSALDSPVRESFIMEQKSKINARLWFELGRNVSIIQTNKKVSAWFKDFINRKIFHREVSKYKNEEK